MGVSEILIINSFGQRKPSASGYTRIKGDKRGLGQGEGGYRTTGEHLWIVLSLLNILSNILGKAVAFILPTL